MRERPRRTSHLAEGDLCPADPPSRRVDSARGLCPAGALGPGGILHSEWGRTARPSLPATLRPHAAAQAGPDAQPTGRAGRPGGPAGPAGPALTGPGGSEPAPAAGEARDPGCDPSEPRALAGAWVTQAWADSA